MALIKEKGAKDDSAVSMDFGQAQDALATGKFVEVQPEGAEAGPEVHQGVWDADAAPAKDTKDTKAK